jgi:tripartite-type tricarboxylate transporter receptor subunit TctC
MKMFRRAALLAPLLLTAALPAAAQPTPGAAYPTRPITMVVPFAAGGPSDTVARLVAEAMGHDLGQTVIIENSGGAGGTIGAARIAVARPDGYNVLFGHIGQATIPTLYRRLSYDPVNAFEPVGLIADVPMTLLGRQGLPAATLAEVVALIRARGDALNYANAGIGAASHLCGLLLMSTVGQAMTTVPFRGTAPAMQELLAGRVDLLCDQTTQTTTYIQAGSVQAYAVTIPQRLASLPNLPTSTEGGLPGFQVAVWHGLYLPRGTPAPVIARLSQALQAALRDPKVVSRFADLGTAPVAQDQATPAAHRAYWLADIAKWAPIIRAAGQFAD